MITRYAVVLIPILFAALASILHNDRTGYMALTSEDGPVEWCTVICLVLSGILSAAIALKLVASNRTARHTCFFAIFAVLCFIASGEEVSWGQRIFGFGTPHFFQQHNYQNETSIHNLVPVHLKHLGRFILGSAMCIYGILLPLAARNPRLRRLFRTRGLAVPPPALSVSFLLGCMLMIDKPTGQEEEVGELFFSLCFLIFMLHEYRQRIFGNSRA